MPELPEVEVLARHLGPLLKGRIIRGVTVRRAKVLAPTPVGRFQRTLRHAMFQGLSRRGKYLLFELKTRAGTRPLILVGHLGMTGRFYLARTDLPLAKHAAVVFDLGDRKLVYEDTRYFGRLTLDTTPLAKLGPEPLRARFTTDYLAQALKRSRQPIKVKLLDQSLVAGVGNIYASEALFRARISPRLAARELNLRQVRRLRQAIRNVLTEAVAWGSTLPLHFGAEGKRDGLFYFGRAVDAADYDVERLRVYDRKGRPCPVCGAAIRRAVQGARSTFYCPRCQR